MDKLRALTYFVETAENASFSAAAKRFDVPASSVSRRIADLESSLGAQLLKRSTRAVTLTEVGELFLNEAKGILARVKLAEQTVHNYQTEPSGVLKVSAMAGFGEQILLPILEDFANQYPNITLDVTVSDELTKLARDDVDIAVRGGFAPNEHVIAKRLMDNAFIPVAAPAYIAQHGLPETPLALTGHSGLFFKTPRGPNRWFCEINGQWHDVSGKTLLSSNSGRWLINSAVKGKGILMLPRWSVKRELATGQLVELTFEQPLQVSRGQDLGIYLLYQKVDYTSPKVKAAVDFIVESISSLTSNPAISLMSKE
ncbi:LysR family transcriptional regulator [Alteromonas gilva]|uniref:LysR family transcriptional regulator n=1 Tax=Alteromonas gilva TaxID=2987522 RepID=A0ABT5KWQ1_9ALTE|nr:LysR family transcriptional regulator [Alteromonas gilva]MDC8829195.1 LysR family transcriptional regulator [Alteromonas gilva]